MVKTGIGLLAACAVLAGGFGGPAPSYAAGDIPVPAHKPDLDHEGGDKANFIQTLLQDFTKSLLTYEEDPIPVPRPRPQFITYDPAGDISDDELAKYAKIFTLQEAGKLDEAAAVMGDLRDMRLRGHVLYQRYMHRSYRSSYDELYNWMVLYADHPGASRIYRLALSRRPQGRDAHLPRPQEAKSLGTRPDPTVDFGRSYRSERKRDKAERKKVSDLTKSIRRHISRNQFRSAEQKLRSDEARLLLDPVEQDLLFADMAGSLFYNGYPDKAYHIAAEAAQRSGLHVPKAGWIAGLVAWMEEDYKSAAHHFEIAARSSYATGWTASAGAYWAARSYMRRGKVRQVSTWLKRAMEHPRSFYGLIATRALGRDFAFNWDVPTFDEGAHALMSATPAGWRAMALTRAGQSDLAEAELLRMDIKDDNMRKAVLAYANYAKLPALAMRIGNAASDEDGALYDAALYPTAAWAPEQGYTIDPALIHAIMRQESRFDANAKSPRGAQGLMQIMPRTANYVAKKSSLEKGAAKRLDDPEINLALGQDYLGQLLSDKYVDHDLIRLLIAYNAGPGNLSRWSRQWSNIDDPLLLVEVIGAGETRAYVERVLANYWIYRLREGLPTPTLDALAAGQSARYASADNDQEFKLADSR